MDKSERQRLKQLALDTIIASPVHSREATLAEALEKCVEALDDYDAMADKSQALEEENGALSDTVDDLRAALQDIYRVSKSANSSDVKRLAEIQEIVEEADVDLSKIV